MGCKHTIGSSVDEDGCCISCGQDINFIAINDKLQAKNTKLNDALRRIVYIAEQASKEE